jgi:hypothetical protein
MDPLFVADLDTLKANLRLSGANSSVDSDIDTLIQRAVRSVRVFFRKHLSQARIERIQGILQASPVDPDDSDEYLRELAELTEINQTWIELSYILPALFVDSGADAKEVFEEEGPFRLASQEDLYRMRNRYKTEVMDAIDILKGDGETFDENTSARIRTFGPDSTKRIGRSWRRRK